MNKQNIEIKHIKNEKTGEMEAHYIRQPEKVAAPKTSRAIFAAMIAPGLR